MGEIKMPEDMVEGSECLQYGIPWQVPESIIKEADNLTMEDNVLEVGTGGSTLFFANRCNSILAIETNEEWYDKVFKRLIESGCENFQYLCATKEDQIIDLVASMKIGYVTVFSVDTQGGFNRSKILDAFLSKGVSPNLRMIVLDNYAHEGLFPDHYNKDNFMGEEWEVFTYDHPRWAGNGTRLYIKK